MDNKTDKKMGFCIKRHKIILMNCMDYNYFFSKMIISLGYSRVEVAVDVVARSEATRQSHKLCYHYKAVGYEAVV
ncbi:MAG: hypothetical protein WBC02_00220, partial [Candidatus Aminicenantaceae bacterium]